VRMQQESPSEDSRPFLSWSKRTELLQNLELARKEKTRLPNPGALESGPTRDLQATIAMPRWPSYAETQRSGRRQRVRHSGRGRPRADREIP
jgi:hypothetical protein